MSDQDVQAQYEALAGFVNRWTGEIQRRMEWFACTVAASLNQTQEPEPEIPVGTAGTATVKGVEGVRVMRSHYMPHHFDAAWISNRWVDGEIWHGDADVRDFRPDQEPLAEWEHELLRQDREREIRAEERERIARLVDNGEPGALFQSTDHRGNLVSWLRGGAR